jgi:ketosteroid isomerase-like protein
MQAKSPEDVDRLFAECLNRGDVDGVVALYETSAALLMQEGAPIVGTEAIRGAIAQFAAMKPHLRMAIQKVVHGGGDIAVVYNDWTLTFVGPDGKTVEDGGKACEIVRRQPDGSWKFVVDDPRMRG